MKSKYFNALPNGSLNRSGYFIVLPPGFFVQRVRSSSFIVRPRGFFVQRSGTFTVRPRGFFVLG